MIQNLKVDTIYYLTNSDFEMEFNLCGCCKMRLLTDKAENPKNFVGLLSRAVSRSQVIICCGKLFGNDGLINIVSQSIRKPLTVIDNTAYDITDSNEIKIISGSVPLVNSDGCFCGCIAESGPQAIILLTDNKGIRKTVMKQLIHPYIEELSIIRNTDKTEVPTEEEKTSVETSPVEETIEQPETDENLSEDTLVDTSAEADNEIIDNSTIESVSDDDNTQTDDSINIDLDSTDTTNEPAEEDDSFVIPAFVAPTKINDGFELYLGADSKNKKRKTNDDNFSFNSQNDIKSNTQKSDVPKPLNISILIIAIVLLCALAALTYLLVFIPMRSNYVFSEYIKNIFSVSVNIKTLL